MRLNRIILHDFRTLGSPTPVPEPIEVMYYNEEYVAPLAEVPDNGSPVTVLIGGNARTVVTGIPNPGECRIKTYGNSYLPLIEFHPNDNGLTGTVDYTRTGSILTDLHVKLEQEFNAPLITNYATVAALTAAVPPQSDSNTRGYPGDKALLTDGTQLVSDGTVWGIPGIIDVASFASLAAAIASPTTAGKTIRIATAVTCDTLTIPADRSIDCVKGGSIGVNASHTLTVNGPFSAGLYQVFPGAGNVVFGDGSIETDFPQWWGGNTAANINKAINAFPHTTCPGVYDLETQVLPISFTTLKGHRGSTVFRRPTGVSYTGYSDAFMVGFSSHGTGNYTARTNVTIEDIIVDGNSYNGTDSGALSGIYLHSGSKLRVQGCAVKNLGRTADFGLSSGIVLSWTKGAVVEDCDVFDNTGDGINAYAYNISGLITGNRAHNNGVAGIELEGRIGENYTLARNKSMVISDNLVYENCGSPWGSGGVSYGHGILVDWSDNIVIKGNAVYNNVIPVWAGAVTLLGCTHVTVTVNSIHDNIQGEAGAGGYGIAVISQYNVYNDAGVNKDINIINNPMVGNKNGILIEDALDVLVAENTIERTNDFSDGILIKAVYVGSHATVRDNTIKAYSGSACIGVYGDYNDVTIKDNRCLSGLYGVALYSENSIKTGINIKDNTFDSVTNGILGFPGVELKDGEITGNTFKGTITDAFGGGGGNIILSSMTIKDNHFVAGAINAVWPIGVMPTTGTWRVNYRVEKYPPVVGQPKGWVCTVAGTPGTWTSEGNL